MRWTIRFRPLVGVPKGTPVGVSPDATDGYEDRDPGGTVATGAELTPSRQAIVPLFVLFAFSGVTGLIYESLWSHYLMLFLGHAAFAQSFVLIVFMGGLALGAWLTSRLTARIENLLWWYGVVEATIGVLALAFHPVFVWLMDVSLDRVVPALGSPFLVELYKLSLSGALLLPPTILLGMAPRCSRRKS